MCFGHLMCVVVQKRENKNEKAIENKPDFDTKNKKPIKNVDKKTETFILIVCGQLLVDEVP